jgi:uncharacterized membrane protein
VVQQERYEEARTVLVALHGKDNETLVAQELFQIREQIQLEALAGTSFYSALRQLLSRRHIRRTSLACFILIMGQFSGSSVIQNYQSIFYKAVGFTGKTSLLISGVYGIMGVIGQVIYLFVVADRWPRTRTLWVGSIFLCVMVAICMALSANYGSGTTNVNGPRGAIATIFIYSAGYAVFFNAMVWVIPSELFPFILRSAGMGLGVFSKSVSAIILSQITPVALENVGWKYYALFIATNFAAAFVYYFFLPETGGKSLEEIAELFGDTLATAHLDQMEGEEKSVQPIHMEKVV